VEPVALTKGMLKSTSSICSNNPKFFENILDRYRNISRNSGFIGRLLNKKKDLMFGILDFEYLVFHPWVIMEEKKFNSREFLFCPVSLEPKFQVENYLLQKKTIESPSIEQPVQKGILQCRIPISISGAENGFLEISPGISGILDQKQILSFIFQMSVTSDSFGKYLSSKPISLMDHLNIQSGLTEMPVTIPFLSRSGNVGDTSQSQIQDGFLFEYSNMHNKQNNRFYESETNKNERRTSHIGHLLTFSYNNSNNKIKNGFTRNKQSIFSPDTLYSLYKWMVFASSRLTIPSRSPWIPQGQIFNQEEILHPIIELKRSQMLKQGPFTGDLKDNDRRRSLSIFSASSDLPSFPPFSIHSNDLTKTSTQRKAEGLLDREKRLHPEIGMKEVGSLDKGTVTGEISSQVPKQLEYGQSPPRTFISNRSLPDGYPNKGEKTDIDFDSTASLKKERARSEKGNILNELGKDNQIRRTSINLISDLFAINHGFLNKRNSVFFKKSMNTNIGAFDERLSYHLSSRSGFQNNRFPINPEYSSNSVIKSGNETSGPPIVFGEVPLPSPIVPSEKRRSTQQNRAGLIDQLLEEDLIARTQRTHPLPMELVHMNKKIPPDIAKMKTDVVEEERSSSLRGPSTNQMHLDIHHLTEQVYQMLEKKFQIERERRGM